ncbi:hypothetical protein [Oceanispirochaeta sp.]|uniref:hypothetical protein n=1 Tax=Oceanispirochaeta sp. TaxID=2035350 RepID=UPI0026291672|nr:hypothetical protein [Oceanispirochaeta sp.]MDA3958157.1 hypothetical protein [Oceanispirochaeta sp.]
MSEKQTNFVTRPSYMSMTLNEEVTDKSKRLLFANTEVKLIGADGTMDLSPQPGQSVKPHF